MLISIFAFCIATFSGVSAAPHIEEKRDYAACVTAVSKAPRRQAISDCASFRYLTTYPCAITGLCAGPTLLPSQASTCETGSFQPTDIPAYASCAGDQDSYISACANIGVVAQTSYRPRPYCINGPMTTMTATQTVTMSCSASIPGTPTAGNAQCPVATTLMNSGNQWESVYSKTGYRGESLRYPCKSPTSNIAIFAPYTSVAVCQAVQICSIKLLTYPSFTSFTVHQALDNNLWTCIGYKGVAGASDAWEADSNIGSSVGYKLPAGNFCT